MERAVAIRVEVEKADQEAAAALYLRQDAHLFVVLPAHPAATIHEHLSVRDPE